MAPQLSREQGITLRGSAEIVAEFFCKSSSRGAEGGESRAQAARRPAAQPERPRIPAPVAAASGAGRRDQEVGRRAPPPLALLRAEEEARVPRGPALRWAPWRERFFPVQSSSHTPRPRYGEASGVDRDGLDFGKRCSELARCTC